MGKIKDNLSDREMNDTYRTHAIHETYDEHCSTCFAENIIINRRNEDEDNGSALHPLDGSSPWDKNPLN